GRRVEVPRRALDHRARRGAAPEPRLRDGPPELRDVEQLHEPGDGPDRALPERVSLREEGVHAAEAPGRARRAAAPREARGEADRDDEGAVGVPGRAGRGAVQARSLQVLSAGVGPAPPPYYL